MKKKAEKIRALWRKYKSLRVSSVLAEYMQRVVGASLYDRNEHFRRRIPSASKAIERRGKGEKKEQIRKERRKWIEHIVRLQTDRTSVEEGKEESKKDKKTSKHKHACQEDYTYCLGTTFESIRPKVKSPEALCRKCLDLKRNLKATSQMETLFFRLITKDSREHQLKPIYDIFESTATSATTKKILLMPLAK